MENPKSSHKNADKHEISEKVLRKRRKVSKPIDLRDPVRHLIVEFNGG
jgi:hypothetical protein